MMANKKARRRRFGAVRELPSGQWQARYRGPDGIFRPADKTSPTKTDAEVWLTTKEAEILNGEWINPDAGKVLLSDYGTTWIEERPNLRPKTVRLYGYLLRRHIKPHFKDKTVAEIKEAHIRRWRKNLLDSDVSAVTTAKAYRLLKAILNTAVDDGIIKRNPCRIKGAGQEESAERPVLTITEVYALAEAIDQRYRARAPRHLREPAVGRTGRAPPDRYRPGQMHDPSRASAHRAARGRGRFRPAEVQGR
jgi:integrase